MEDNNVSAQAYKRFIPTSSLDVEFQTINSMWGTLEVNPQFIAKLNKMWEYHTGKTKDSYNIEDLWSLLSFYTRDLRLANLNMQELAYCEYWLNLAADTLMMGFVEPFLMMLARVASKTELTQAKGGFLRRRQGTITSENYSESREAPKKSWFGSNKAPQQYGYGGR